MDSFFLHLILFAATTWAKTVPYHCTEFIVPVGVENVTIVIPPSTLPNGFAATAFANSITQRDPATLKLNTTKLTKTFNISAEYCSPSNSNPSTLQILTHGLGFDRSYWDFRLLSAPSSTNYSYIAAAMKANYSTLSWNRLGIAPSTIADPYTEVQGLVELAVLANLTTMVRKGVLPNIPVPEKVLHVGHSWGSELTNALVASAPSLSDGIILTGYSHSYDFQPLFIASTSLHLANTNQPRRFPKQLYSNGYLTWPDVFANQYSFLHYPYFNASVALHTEATKQPFTAGEFLSQALLPFSASNFTGPVLYLNGADDVVFCGGNCVGLVAANTSAVKSFSDSPSVDYYLQPNTGHAVNVHYNATGAFRVMLGWAERHGF